MSKRDIKRRARPGRTLRAPRVVWIEWSDDYVEILATYSTEREAREEMWQGSKLSGPYRLESRSR